ncbi:MAG: LamG domain-containing protein [Deltaproteobacteria bacterium]|nr:LamG domain-containing protein [Deltaproteobacteria bacterium]
MSRPTVLVVCVFASIASAGACSITTPLDGLSGGVPPGDAAAQDQGSEPIQVDAGSEDVSSDPVGSDVQDASQEDASDSALDAQDAAEEDVQGQDAPEEALDAATDPQAEPPPTPVYAPAVLADDPIGYWRFGELAGPLAKDSSLSKIDGTYVGLVAFGATGAIVSDPDPAILLNGSQPHVTFGDQFDFQGLQPFSVEAWIRPSAIDNDYRRLLAKETVDSQGKQGYFLTVQQAGLGFERWTDNQACAITGDVPSMVEFTHVVGTFDGATMILYMNGVSVGTSPCSHNLIDHANPFVVGATSAESFNFYGGVVDEVAVYDKPLSAIRVKAHYDAGKGL